MKPAKRKSTRLRTAGVIDRLLAMPTRGAPAGDIAGVIAELVGAAHVDFWRLDGATGTLVARSSEAQIASPLAENVIQLPLVRAGALAEVIRSGVPYRTGRAEVDLPALVVPPGGVTRSALVTTLEVGGERRGLVVVRSPESDAFDDHDRQALQAAVNLVGLTQHRSELMEQVATAAAERGQRMDGEQMVNVVAHKLKNRLTAIKVRAELVGTLGQGDGGAEGRNGARLVASVDRLHELVVDLLDVDRLTCGAMVVHPQRLCLSRLAQDVAATSRAPRRRIDV